MVATSNSERKREWDALVSRLRKLPLPEQSEDFARLYELALADGARRLAVKISKTTSNELEDVALDVFMKTWRKLLAPEVQAPRAFFLSSCVNAAYDRLRSAEVQDRAVPNLGYLADTARRSEGDAVETIELRARLRQLPERSRSILLAVAMGESRDDLARAYGISRAAIDQIVSRARREAEAE